MKKLGKKVHEMLETIEAYSCSCDGGCSAYCYTCACANQGGDPAERYSTIANPYNNSRIGTSNLLTAYVSSSGL